MYETYWKGDNGDFGCDLSVLNSNDINKTPKTAAAANIISVDITRWQHFLSDWQNFREKEKVFNYSLQNF